MIYKKNKEETEENHIINNMFDKDLYLSNSIHDILIERLLEIKKINKSDPVALINFVEYLLDKNIDTNKYLLDYLIKIIFKLDKSTPNIEIKIINKYS